MFSYLDKLRLAPSDAAELSELRSSPLWQEHELAHALLNCCRGLPLPPIELTSQGACFLYGKGGYPWGALPYPCEHAELAKLLFMHGEEEKARKMAAWQGNTLDHQGRPLSFFLQQEGAPPEPLLRAVEALIEATGGIPLATKVADHDLGLLGLRSENATAMVCATGCKSGMGCFLHGDAGIVNYGPQRLPLGESTAFGLAGKPIRQEIMETPKGFCMTFQTALAAPSPRSFDLPFLQDSGYSGLWIEATHHLGLNEAFFTAELEGFVDPREVAIVFFGVGESALVARHHKLNPGSLDRYIGPAKPVTFGSVTLESLGETAQMEVIPLAGDGHFFGANFLVAFTLASPQLAFSFKT